MSYYPPSPPSYQEAMAERLRETVELQKVGSNQQGDSTGTRKSKAVTFSAPTINYTAAKTDLALAQNSGQKTVTSGSKRQSKKEQETIVFTGVMSSRAVNRMDACVLTAMTASLLAIPLMPLYCSWSYLKRHKWQLYLTNKGLHYTEKAYKLSFISLQDVRHVCLESERGSCVIVTVATGAHVRMECVGNATELVRAVRRQKGWCQPRILTE